MFKMWCNEADESKIDQIQFAFFWLIVYIICKTTFDNRPYWNWSIGSKDTGSWRIAKTIGSKEIFSFV